MTIPKLSFLNQAARMPVSPGDRRAACGKPGSCFFILDSDHSKKHVLSEMISIRDVLQPDDYVIVEDANVNGHPIAKNWGAGPSKPWRNTSGTIRMDYGRDIQREQKFAFTFATNGFLVFRKKSALASGPEKLD